MAAGMALLVVDVQNDFCPGGALQISDGDRVVAPLNRAIERFAACGLPVFASRDWHPETTRHFQREGGLWPVHCVQGSKGAAFHPDLRLPENTEILSKGMDPQLDGYSAFEGVSITGATLAALLAAAGADHLCIGGLATEYCVRTTVLEALKQGFTVTVLAEGVAGVESKPGDSQQALAAMQEAGARIITVDDLEL